MKPRHILLILFVSLFSKNLNAKKIEKRIVNGIRVDTAPFMASLQNKKYEGHFCSGIYVGKGWVLSASHCFSNDAMCDANVVLGKTNLKEKNFAYEIVTGYRKDYNRYTYNDDISLLKLNMSESDEIYGQVFVEIPKNININIFDCHILGYGSKDYAGEKSQYLLQGKVEVISYQKCQESIGAVMVPEYPKMFCAEGLRGVDACSGDSGGPLICRIQNSTLPALIGLVSYGTGCGMAAGAYTNVIHHSNWIKEKMLN